MITIKVKLKQNPHNIYLGKGILSKIGDILKNRITGKKVLIISNKKIFKLHGKNLINGIKKYFKYNILLLPDGEKYKNLETVNLIYKNCIKFGLDRHSAIIAFGGGVIGDTVGFAAATYMRGINLVQVPTTLLAQVDSSIGGKTGVDLKEGKNLIGSFYQPIFVLSDIDVLKTLNKREFKNGLVEIIKYGIIMDKEFFYYLKNNYIDILNKKDDILINIIKKSILCKTKIVEKDEKEKTGLRAILNYGHTVGHAIEAEGKYQMYKHGEAVAIGMVIAAKLALRKKLCSKETYKEQIEILRKFNLIKPLKINKISNIIKHLYNDKKALNGKIRFILTKKIGCVSFIKNINVSIIKKELEQFRRYGESI
jgi:3-dehydroquinate synthase